MNRQTSNVPSLDRLAQLNRSLFDIERELDQGLTILMTEATRQTVEAARKLVTLYDGTVWTQEAFATAVNELTTIALDAVAMRALFERAHKPLTEKNWWSIDLQHCIRAIHKRMTQQPGTGGCNPVPAPASVDRSSNLRAASNWLNEHRDELPANHWVAVSKDGLLAFDHRLEVVHKTLDELGISTAEVVITKVPDRTAAWA